MIARIVSVTIESTDTNNVSTASVALDNNQTLKMFGDATVMKGYEGKSGNIATRVDKVNGILMNVISYIEVQSIGAMVQPDTTDEFNVIISNNDPQLTALNFDPRAVKGTYKGATVLIIKEELRETNDGRKYVELECAGCTSKFKASWWFNQADPGLDKYPGKIVLVDIAKNGQWFNFESEPVVLDVQLFNNADYDRAEKFIQEATKQNAPLISFMNKFNYFAMMSSSEPGKLQVIKLALALSYAHKLCKYYIGTNQSVIDAALVIRSTRALISNPEINPDMALFSKVYTPNWIGNNIVKYVLSDANVYTVDRNRHIIQTCEDIVDKIYYGGCLV